MLDLRDLLLSNFTLMITLNSSRIFQIQWDVRAASEHKTTVTFHADWVFYTIYKSHYSKALMHLLKCILSYKHEIQRP